MRPEAVRELDEAVKELVEQQAKLGRYKIAGALAFVGLGFWIWLNGYTIPPARPEHFYALAAGVAVAYCEGRQAGIKATLRSLEAMQQLAYRVADLEAAQARSDRH